MNFTTYILCFLAGLLGIAFHIFAIKIPTVKTQAKVANMTFSYSTFFQDELAAILASLLTVIILILVLDEIVAYKPAVLPYIKAGFVFVGYTGSSLLVTWLGKAADKINAVVDVKSNLADGLPPPDTAPKTDV